MVGLNKVDSAVVAFMCVMFISQASCARLLDNFLQEDATIKDQVLNLARPQQKFEGLSRFLETPEKKFESESRVPEKVVSKYEYLILNVLPKGTPVPPSGPSKRINSNLD